MFPPYLHTSYKGTTEHSYVMCYAKRKTGSPAEASLCLNKIPYPKIRPHIETLTPPLASEIQLGNYECICYCCLWPESGH